MTPQRILLALCIAFGVPHSAAPQSLGIGGRVFLSGDSSRAVADAEVALLPGLRIVRSDSGGAFLFLGVGPGSYTLRVRKVGFEPFRSEVLLRAEEGNTTIAVPLRTGTQVLAEIVVSGHRLLFPARLAEPYARFARGRGAFFVSELIDSLRPWDVSSLLVRVPGVRVNDRGVRIGRCENHGATPGQPGKLHVFLDGVRQTAYSSHLSHGAGDVLRSVAISSVQLMEVHTSINTIPPEYADDACAVILIWSK